MSHFQLSDLIDDRPSEGIFQVSRAIYTDPGLFDLEMARIFEAGWVYLGMTSQASNPHDFFTTSIGRVPVIVSRDKAGELRCFINACPHKGTRIANVPAGSAKLHVCPYHSWTFDSAGRNKNVKWESSGGYSKAFQCADHNLVEIPRFDEYRGFLFGSLSPDVPSLDGHLGGAARTLDLLANQSPHGLELVPGRVRYTYRGNWKMQLENCSDQYHFTSTHPSLVRVLENRASQDAKDVAASAIGNADFWKEGGTDVAGGSYSFENGHVMTWGKRPPDPSLPLFERSDELLAERGPGEHAWMFNMRNVTIFPNLQIADNAALQIRVIRPLSVDKTEMQTWCLATKGESPAARNQRIRQYEDFFNPTGLAIPDDNACYEECELGLAAQSKPWLQGHARGETLTKEGGNAFADAIALKPQSSVTGPSQLGDETLLRNYYRAWSDRMKGVLA